MFGVDLKISDGSLYLLSDIVENQIETLKSQLSECSPTEVEKIKEIKLRILFFQAQLKKFESDVEKQLKERFQFSIEEIYSMYGQYEDRYVNIEFHKYSDSAKKFGTSISGVFVYWKKEREALEIALGNEGVPRTNGLLKINCSNNKGLTDTQKTELIEEGFMSGDIYEVLAVNIPQRKSYGEAGIKEIPNTINISNDLEDFDPYYSSIFILRSRIKKGIDLTAEEWAQYCGYMLYYVEDSKSDELIQSKGFDEDGKLSLVRFYELKLKIYYRKFEKEELLEFMNLLTLKKEERLEAIQKEIGKSVNKKLTQFKVEFPEIAKRLEDSALHFEEEALVYQETIIPIYWDLKGFLHIYLRHCAELEIEGHFKNKTNFQYSQKDIRRILVIAIKKYYKPINKRLSEGKDFRIYGDRSLYFNGNYYALYIESNGRVAAFYPLEGESNAKSKEIPE